MRRGSYGSWDCQVHHWFSHLMSAKLAVCGVVVCLAERRVYCAQKGLFQVLLWTVTECISDREVDFSQFALENVWSAKCCSVPNMECNWADPAGTYPNYLPGAWEARGLIWHQIAYSGRVLSGSNGTTEWLLSLSAFASAVRVRRWRWVTWSGDNAFDQLHTFRMAEEIVAKQWWYFNNCQIQHTHWCRSWCVKFDCWNLLWCNQSIPGAWHPWPAGPRSHLRTYRHI